MLDRSTAQQANKLNLFACGSIPIRSFHITWVTLFWCHFAWFSTTNILREINDDFPLTIAQQQFASSLSVTSTLFFRVAIAFLCPKYGSRKTYVLVLLCTIVTLGALALVQNNVAYMIVHIFLGIAGSAFVVTEYHTTQLFTEQIAGSAQAITAGFGIFGGGTVNFIGPVMVYYLGWSWRAFLVSVAGILFLLCFIYYFGSKDNVQSVGSHPVQSGTFEDAFYEYRTWVLFACYAVCCGVEIVFYIVAAQYFQLEHGLSEIESGLIVMVWSSMNLWARPLGGHLCDKYEIPQRAKILFVLLFLESICIILFGAVGHFSLSAGVVLCMMFSICIQMAEGATFSIVAFVRPKAIGHVIGIVSSGGSVGAAFFIFVIFAPWSISDYDYQYSWVVLGVVVMILSFCALMIQFTTRELHDSKQNMKANFDLRTVQTQNIINTNGVPGAGINCLNKNKKGNLNGLR